MRTLLINGASAHLRQQKRRGISDPWLRELLARRLYKVAMVAFAAKTARIIWAMLAKGEADSDRTTRRLLPKGRQPLRSALILSERAIKV